MGRPADDYGEQYPTMARSCSTTAKPDRQPADVFPVASFLLDEMAERAWTVADLAEHAHLPEMEVRAVLDGGAVGPRVAIGFARAFGGGAGLWLNLDRAWWSALEWRLDKANRGA